MRIVDAMIRLRNDYESLSKTLNAYELFRSYDLGKTFQTFKIFGWTCLMPIFFSMYLPLLYDVRRLYATRCFVRRVKIGDLDVSFDA